MKINVWKMSTLALTAALGISMAANFAAADQPHMQSALRSLDGARIELDRATADKGGHRAAAIELVNKAIDQVKEGIAFDRHH